MPLAADGFQAFTPQHYLLIGIFLAGALGLIVVGRSRRKAASGDRFDRAFAVAIVVVTVPSQLYQLPGTSPSAALSLWRCATSRGSPEPGRSGRTTPYRQR